MVNVFIVHSSSDKDYVKNKIIPFLTDKIDENGKETEAKEESSANILILESENQEKNENANAGDNTNNSSDVTSDTNSSKGFKKDAKHKFLWKFEAHKKIKQAQVVVVVVGADSADEKKKKTMGWEVSQALKYNKQIMIVNPNDYKLPPYLNREDPYTNQIKPIAVQYTLTEIKERIENFSKGYYNIFSPKYNNPEELSEHIEELMEQYKIFQRTSEDLITRRQAVNSFYISVNSALVALVGIVMGWVESPAKTYIIAFMSLTGVILSFSWSSLLDSYGMLNSAKMKVLNLIEEQLPIALYDVEWKVMSDKLNNKKYVSFTNSEKRIPKIFAAVYLVIILALMVYFVLNKFM